MGKINFNFFPDIATYSIQKLIPARGQPPTKTQQD